MDRHGYDRPGPASYSPLAETVPSTPLGTFTGEGNGTDEAAAPGDGRYEVIDRLGEGGMGEVRLCHDSRTQRDVAMKVMRGVHAGRPDLDARFLREARVQGRMEHPSIVPVYDLGISGGRPYFTMKRVLGETLTEIVAQLRVHDRGAQEAYSRHKLLAAFSKVCLTVDFAHAHRIVHRDLKPDNIMLGAYGELYVLDWGIARIAEGDRAAWSTDPDLGPTKTRAGSLLGTLGYMSPEQMDPKLGETDARSDVYALGAILFEILTLEPLHMASNVNDMVASTLADAPSHPSARTPGQGIPPELDDICVKATARDPEKRFASARELHRALERFRVKDRDLEQRRSRAEEHAARAKSAVARAEEEIDPEAPLRTTCLREASRALAFDPTNEGALATLRRLLANPPRVLPAEVVRELCATTRSLATRRGRISALLKFSWFAFLPFALLVGLRDLRLYVLVSVLFAVAAASMLLYSRRPPPDGDLPWPQRVLVATAMASLSVAWSPLVIVPTLAVLGAIASIVLPRRRAWPVLEMITACSIVAVPVLLGEAGVVLPFFGFDGRDMLLLPRMVALPATPTVIVAGVTHLLIVLAIGAIMIRLRSSLDDAQRSLRLQTWQLGQLVAYRAPPTTRAAAIEPSFSRSEGMLDVATIADTAGGRTGLDDPVPSALTDADRYDPRGSLSTEYDGEALLCEDRRIGRQVVMKTVAHGPEGELLARQARLQASLEHPSIPPVYDITEDDAGVHVTTRRLHGQTLEAALLGGGVRSWHELLEVFGEACLVVDYAHAHGVGHGALSSRSVVVGDYGDVYVAGWTDAAPLDTVDEGKATSARRRDVAALGAILAEILGHADAAPELEAICSRATATAEDETYSTAGAIHDAVERYVEGERDVVRRRSRAAEHVRLAGAASERASSGGDAAGRATAMREVSQALALDPSNASAISVLLRLLTVPPRELPPEAAREALDAAHEERRRASRTAAVLYASSLACVPVVVAQGVLSPALTVLLPCTIVAAVVAFWRSSRAAAPREEGISTVVFAMLVACVAGAAAGPLILVPTIVIGNMSGFLLQNGTRRRLLVLALACLAFALPLGLQLAGVLPPSYEARGEALAVLPALTRFSTSTPVILASVQVAIVLSACLFFRRFRDSLQRAEERVHVNAWQLRQLVPVEAQAALSMPPPAG